MQAIFPERTETGAPDTLASLAVASKTSVDEAKPLAESLDLLLQELLGGVIPADPSFAYPDGRTQANRMGFPGLMGDPGMETALQVLEARYEKVPIPLIDLLCSQMAVSGTVAEVPVGAGVSHRG